MNSIELDIAKGMVNILNDAREAYHNGNPIVTDEQHDVRIRYLRELEELTSCVLENSPTRDSRVK